jgi:hypothetical protein
MPEVFHYPALYPGWFIDYFDYLTWCLIVVFLSVVWVVFFRFGKFSYGVDLGCLWKSAVMIIITTAAIGTQRFISVKFAAEHEQDGDSLRITAGELLYKDRNGLERKLPLNEITAIYQETVTYNPPPKIYIVTGKGPARDSLFVTENLQGLESFLSLLSSKTGISVKRP